MQLLKAMLLTFFLMCFLGRTSRGEAPALEYSVKAADIGSGLINSLAVTKGSTIIVADITRKELKVVSLDLRTVGTGLVLEAAPWALALLSDGLLAVSTENNSIFFVNVSAFALTLVSRAHTARSYGGISAGPNDTLIVGSHAPNESYAGGHIDVISRDGHVLRTLFDGTNRTEIQKPFFLKHSGDSVYVSDWGHRVVHKLKIDSGHIETAFSTTRDPREVDFDHVGNMYIATEGAVCGNAEGCVVMVTRDRRWKNFINDSTDTKPFALCTTPNNSLHVAWGRWDHIQKKYTTKLTAYSLSSSTIWWESEFR